jgi:hypothetical protein
MRREQEGRRSGGYFVLVFLLAATCVAGSTVDLPARQPSSVAFHDLAAMTRWPFGGMQGRGGMGQTGSLFIGDVPAGLKTTPHHHHQEQIVLSLAGEMKIPLAGTPHSLPKMTAVFAHSNVQHGILNDSGQPAVYLEFQPVSRPDWFPPHPRRARQGTPEPLPGLQTVNS